MSELAERIANRRHTAETVPSSFNVNEKGILAYLGLDVNDARSHAVVAVARRYNLDPLLKHVIVIPKGGVYITRDGYLHVAHASGQLDGIVVETEPTLTEDKSEWRCRVSVYRKDMSHPFTYVGRYPARGGNAQYAPEMALKNAEAHALRRAFNVSGLPAEDERLDDQPVAWQPEHGHAEPVEPEVVEPDEPMEGQTVIGEDDEQ